MIGRLTGIGRCYSIVIYVEKNLKSPILVTGYDISGTAGECEIRELFG
jgi:hypothetical protein